MQPEVKPPEPEVVDEPTPRPEPEEPVKPGRDHTSFVACESDTDCGWDNSCVPTRCVEASEPSVACEEKAPPPGTCSCVEKVCTLKRSDPPPPSEACEIRGCMIDHAAGLCVADTGGVPEATRTTTPIDEGPSCDCPVPGEPCKFTWIEPVKCRRDVDCWIDQTPRPHPIARPSSKRGRSFQPCKDGTVAPRCSPAGKCTFGVAYKC